MPRWTGPGRFTARGDLALSRSRLADLQSKARKVVGDLENRARIGDIWYGRRAVQIAEGVVVEAIVDATFPNNPLVQARLVIQQPEDSREEREPVFEIYVLRTKFFVGDFFVSDISNVQSVSKFTYAAGRLTHNWEYVFNAGDWNSATNRSFVVDKANSKLLGFGNSTLFNPVVDGFWDCFRSAVRHPITFLEAQSLPPAGSFVEIGSSVVPAGEFHGGESGCSNIFSLGSEASPTPIADFGFRWGTDSDGAVLYLHPEGGYIIADNRAHLEGNDVDPDGKQVSFNRLVGSSAEKLADVVVGDNTIPLAGAQDQRTFKTYTLVRPTFASTGVTLLVFDPVTNNATLHDLTNLIAPGTEDRVYLTKARNKLFISSSAPPLGSGARLNSVLQVDLDTMETTRIVDEGTPVSDIFNQGIKLFGGISAVDGGNTLIVGNAGESQERTALAWIYKKRSGGYELVEEIPMPDGEAHSATSGMLTDRPLMAMQTIQVR